MKGKLRERDGEVTISVTEANEINLDKIFEEGENETKEPYTNGSVVSGNTADKNLNIAQNQNGDSQGIAKPVASRKKLMLSIRESNDAGNDQMLLDDVKRLLLGSSGNDEVGIEIETESSIVVMEWPPVKIDATPELESKLAEVIGSSGKVTIQSLMF